jgi:hypothetical protein
MIYTFWGILAGVVALFIGAAHQAIPTFGTQPAGRHHKPPRPSWRQRPHERNLREQATQQERIFVHARAETSQALAALDTITRKLAALDGRRPGTPSTSGPAVPDETPGSGPAAGPEPLMPLPPEDPHVICGCHDPATFGHRPDCLAGAPEPEPVRLDPEMDYRDETGTWIALRDKVAAEVPHA